MLEKIAAGVLITIAILSVLLWYVTHYFIFVKAGQSGWKCLVPIYSSRIKDRIMGRSAVWLWLEVLCPPLLVPFYVISCFDLARSFGFGLVFGFGLLVTPWLHLSYLAFSGVQYHTCQTWRKPLRLGRRP